MKGIYGVMSPRASLQRVLTKQSTTKRQHKRKSKDISCPHYIIPTLVQEQIKPLKKISVYFFSTKRNMTSCLVPYDYDAVSG